MKKIIVTGFILTLCMLIIPFAFTKKSKKSGSESSDAVAANANAPMILARKTEPETFRIKTEDKIITLSAEEYITGVVAAEMPVSYGIEALKAQSVAAYSFALYKKAHRKDAEYDLTDSYKTDQSYSDENSLKEKWGGSYEKSIEKIKSAVRAVSGEYLSFGGEAALALYHSVSPGKTNSCADVFGGKLPYLVSVNSKSDLLSPDCKSIITFGESELNEKLSSLCKPSDGNSFSGVKKGKSGVVKQIKFAGKTVSGTRLAGLLNLPSPNFTVEYSSGKYTFTCLGRGHGVGLSQYGAGQMAAGGSTYREILAHYYPGTEIEKN